MADDTHSKHLSSFDCMYFCRCLPFYWHLICIEWPRSLTCHNHNENFASCIIPPSHGHHGICSCTPNKRRPVFPVCPLIQERKSSMHKVPAVLYIPEIKPKIVYLMLCSFHETIGKCAVGKTYLRVRAMIFV